MKLLYTRRALRELNAVLDYIAIRSPQGAKNVNAQIKAVTDLLCDNPFLGTATDKPHIRRLVVTPYPYIIFYQPRKNEIIIRSVRHGARKPVN